MKEILTTMKDTAVRYIVLFLFYCYIQLYYYLHVITCYYIPSQCNTTMLEESVSPSIMKEFADL